MTSENMRQAIALAKSGQKDAARKILEQVVQDEPLEEMAWIWLVDTLGTDQDRVDVLRRGLEFLPDSKNLKSALSYFEKNLELQQMDAEEEPVVEELVIEDSPEEADESWDDIFANQGGEVEEPQQVAVEKAESTDEKVPAKKKQDQTSRERKARPKKPTKKKPAAKRKPTLIILLVLVVVLLTVASIFFALKVLPTMSSQGLRFLSASSPEEETLAAVELPEDLLEVEKTVTPARPSAPEGIEDTAEEDGAATSGEELPGDLPPITFESEGEGNQSGSDVIVKNGLMLYYNFDEGEGDSVVDLSGNNVLGSLRDGAKYVDDGIQGRALDLSEDEAYLFVSATPPLFFIDAMTVSAYFLPQSYDQPGALLEWNNNSEPGVQLWTNAKGDLWGEAATGAMLVNAVLPGETVIRKVVATENPTLNQWHHVAVAYDKGEDVAHLYLDGVEVAQTDMSGISLNTMFDLYIGKSPTFSDAKFNGLIDEIRIYNRVLALSEIEELYGLGNQ